jgi:ribosomal protein S18 acetylase RimI-like enzyme
MIIRATLKEVPEIIKLSSELIKEEEKRDKTVDSNYVLKNNAIAKKYYSFAINHHCLLLAKENEKIIGYLSGQIIKKEPFRKKMKIARIEEMYILPRFRSKGIGTQLEEEFINWCKSKKVNMVKVTSSAANKKAIEFYKRNNFKEYDLILEKNI